MYFPHHALIGAAADIPTVEPTAVLSYSPVVLKVKDRVVDLQLRVSVPATGDALPIILLSHGHGRSNYLSSLEGYTPIVDFWASHGFVVIQPTHLSSKSLSLQADDMFFGSRAQDMSDILDQLDTVEAAVPSLKGRLDKERVAVAGHSLGGMTASMLLGAVNTDPRNGLVTEKTEKRIKAGVIIGGTGKGGDSMSENGEKMVPFYDLGFSKMNTPALVLAGDDDDSPHLTSRGWEWHADPYHFAPGSKDLFIVKGGRHGFGGVSGWDAGETEDESPERLTAVNKMTWAYIKSQLYPGDSAWADAVVALKSLPQLGYTEQKQ